MPTPRNHIIFHRRRFRYGWIVVQKPFWVSKKKPLIPLASNADPPPHMREECEAINVMLNERKCLKEGGDLFLKAWWKARGYDLAN